MRAIFCFLSVILSFSSVLPAQTKPNVIVIMADDLGYGDVSCYGSKTVSTPNIDQLAAEGQRFTSGYCTASTCTPTRYSMLTGNYAFRTKGTGIAPPNGPAVIQPGTETVASILHRAGYTTAVIGKWHLGLGPVGGGGKSGGPDWNGELKPGPLEIGFDTCFLLPTTNDRVPQVYVQDHHVLNLDPADPLWVGNKKPSEDHPTGITHRETLKMNWSHGHNNTIHNGISRIGFYTGGHAARFRDEDLADKWIEQSNVFIEANKDKPFFLFFASHDVHVPRIPHERFQGKTSLGFRGDSIVQLDWCVGELMKTLDRLELAENTLVVFCSDNGPVLDDGYQDGAIEKIGEHRAAGQYSGGKYSVYEGGTRTPFITRWTGSIQPGVNDSLVSTVDFAASFAAMTNQTLTEKDCIDSENVLDALLGKPAATGRDHIVSQDNGTSGTYGLRVRTSDPQSRINGDWKLHRYDRLKAKNVVLVDRLENQAVPQYQLFDLTADAAEKTNVIAEHPEIAKALEARLTAIIEH